MGAIDWKEEIVKLVHIKQVLATVDKKGLNPHHLPALAATPEQIQTCERALGFELDDDHRQFLLHANGWEGFVQTTHLFGTDDFLRSHRFNEAENLIKIYERSVFEQVGIPKDAFFPIAASSLDRDLFAMVRPHVASTARVFWFAGYEIDRYPSFSDFFLSMMDYNRLGIKTIRQA